MIRYDTTPYTRQCIEEVVKALRDAIILVALVVLLFLQNWRSAIIPLIAVPVAIIGTFAVMEAMGFSLNNLTLFGLVLAIGIVVDDAIVVVEAVEHHIENGLAAAGRHDQGHEPGLRPGGRRGPGPQRGLRALRIHQRHHGPVLPAVRPDDRRLDDHFGLQFLDPQPGAVGAAAAAAGQGRPPGSPAAVGLRRWRAAGWPGNSLTPGLVAGMARIFRAFPRPSPAIGCRAAPWRGWPAAARAAGWLVGRPLELRAGLALRAFQRRLRRPRRTSISAAWGCCSALSALVLVVYCGLLVLTYWGLRTRPRASSPRRTWDICW